MRKFFLLVMILSSLKLICQEDYVIKLNDTLINIELNKLYNVNIKGSKIKLIVNSKDTLSFINSIYSFQYPKQFKVSNSNIGDGVEQATIVTSEGSGFIIQKYETMNPTTLNETMLTELTKESINYGYKLTRTSYKRKLKSGQEIQVTKAVLRYKDAVNIYEVSSYGKKDEGLMIVTMKMDEKDDNEGFKLINMFWKSLSIN